MNEEPRDDTPASRDETRAREVTLLLRSAHATEPEQIGRLFALVHEELRIIARRHMKGERASHTLQATALVNEAYLKLVGASNALPWESRERFYAAAAEAMRRILLDHAKGRAREKRGGDRERLPLDALELVDRDDPQQVIQIDDALTRLERRDPRMAQLVKLRFYAGLTETEVAATLGVSDRHVRREWTVARAWLQRALGRNDE
ncbi:MAG: sigma-70 family RNA polymerase sigma factor [Planctomycetes bacterium]|nr:sigma-70 family RNA polymerase sigma factor [Planctomycetota bacterium]